MPRFPQDENAQLTYRNELATEITKNVFALADEHRKEYGSDFVLDVLLQILSSTVATLVRRSLEPDDKLSPAEQEKMIREQYSVVKGSLQHAISSGFSGAFLSFDEESEADFYCEIKPVGQPVNKLPI